MDSICGRRPASCQLISCHHDISFLSPSVCFLFCVLCIYRTHLLFGDTITRYDLIEQPSTDQAGRDTGQVRCFYSKLHWPELICSSPVSVLCMSGMGDPAYFYVTCVFLLNGVMMSLFFIYGAYLRYAHTSTWDSSLSRQWAVRQKPFVFRLRLL